MSLADIKLKARRLLHARAAVAATLTDDDHPSGLIFPDGYAGPGLVVRYHNKIDRSGDLDGDWAEVIDGIDRLVFSDENIAAVSAALVEAGELPLSLDRAAVVTIPEYKGLRFTLDSQQPPDGPLETIWVVARSRA
jgi:hypothetical protein